jgi:hypothetical protein
MNDTLYDHDTGEYYVVNTETCEEVCRGEWYECETEKELYEYN